MSKTLELEEAKKIADELLVQNMKNIFVKIVQGARKVEVAEGPGWYLEFKVIRSNIFSLIEAGANPHQRLENGLTLTNIAAIYQDLPMIRMLRDKRVLDSGAAGIDGRTALHSMFGAQNLCGGFLILVNLMTRKDLSSDARSEIINQRDQSDKTASYYLVERFSDASESSMHLLIPMLSVMKADFTHLESEINQTGKEKIKSVLQIINSELGIEKYVKIFCDAMVEISLLKKTARDQLELITLKEMEKHYSRLQISLIEAVMDMAVSESFSKKKFSKELMVALRHCQESLEIVKSAPDSRDEKDEKAETLRNFENVFLYIEETRQKLAQKIAEDAAASVQNLEPKKKIKPAASVAIVEPILLSAPAPSPAPRTVPQKSNPEKWLELLSKISKARVAERRDFEELQRLIALPDIDVNTRTSDGKTVFKIALTHKNNAAIDAILNSQDLEIAAVFSEMASVVQANNQTLAKLFLRNATVISRSADLSEKDFEDLFQTAKKAAKGNKQIDPEVKNFSEVVKKLRQEKSVTTTQEMASDLESKIGKKTKKKVKKEARTALQEAEQDPEESVLKRLPHEENFAVKSLEETMLAEIVPENPLPQIAIDVAEFSEEVLDFDLRLIEEGKMEIFLQNYQRETIETVEDLPDFLSNSCKKLLAAHHRVMLKGSAVFQGSSRLPNDLDLEIFVAEMRRYTDREVVEFVRENFDLDAEIEVKIFRGNQRYPAFTVSVEDPKRKLDISIYDSNLPPNPELDWILSTDRKISFEEKGAAKPVISSGLLQEVLRRSSASSDGKESFFINPKARQLTLRLAFLTATNRADVQDVFEAIAKINSAELAQNNPKGLLVKELKLEGMPDDHLENKVFEGVNKFLEKRNFSSKERVVFLQNLQQINEMFLQVSESNCLENLKISAAIDQMVEISKQNLQASGKARNPSGAQLSAAALQKTSTI